MLEPLLIIIYHSSICNYHLSINKYQLSKLGGHNTWLCPKVTGYKMGKKEQGNVGAALKI